jgi:hypothetical protein
MHTIQNKAQALEVNNDKTKELLQNSLMHGSSVLEILYFKHGHPSQRMYTRWDNFSTQDMEAVVGKVKDHK